MCTDLKAEMAALESKGVSVLGGGRSKVGFGDQDPAARRR